MEEILASIRQIISEDLASTAAAEGHPHAADADDDLLVLKNRAPPEPSPFAAPEHLEATTADPPPAETETTETEPMETGTMDTVTMETGTAEARDAERSVADAQPADPEPVAARSLTVAPSAELAVVEPATAAAVTASFERLSFVVENTPPSPPFPVSAGGGTTLEDITRDILTPVIKAWLDENLPDIVRARVDEEVERITRGRVR
jgi:cell pole-organizing protein PopZ